VSRAFVKDDVPAPELQIERPVSDRPNYVTPRGLQQLRSALEAASRAGDERQVRYLQARIESAILRDTPPSDAGTIAFGATVSLRDERGRPLQLRIVGEDESDPRHGSISWDSPVAQALLEHRAGQTVTVLRPAGPIRYAIEGVAYESDFVKTR
jgi:transcription elongation factor GreB